MTSVVIPDRDTRLNREDFFRRCADVLTDGENPRVWSLLVTFFGDLVQSGPDRVSGALLTRFGQLAGLKPEATRVALHRLRRDGWIDSRRCGRTSNYYLTAKGQAESAAASPKIYAREDVFAETWTLLILDPDKPSDTALSKLIGVPQCPHYVDDGFSIIGDIWSGNTDTLLAVMGRSITIPNWLKNRLVSDELICACDRLLRLLEELDQLKPEMRSFTPLERAALRILVVHSWRRVRLKQPELPDGFFPKAWRGGETRQLVADLLQRLPRPPLDLLESEANGGARAKVSIGTQL